MLRCCLLLALACHAVATSGLLAEEPLTRIAFGSCADQAREQPVWQAIHKEHPNVFVWLGDNIYGDTENMALLKTKYGLLGAQSGYRELKKSTQVLAIWDDHDYGVNDGGREYPKRVESQAIFLDFFGEPADSPRRKQEGVYDARIFGPEGQRVQIILLDTRYHRSPLTKKTGAETYLPDKSPEATFLGARQWTWLEEQLRQPAEVRIIASSIQVVPEDHTWEKWMNFPLERDKLFNLIGETKAEGVIFISGDRHLAELSLLASSPAGYALYDLTSSGLNQSDDKWRELETNRHRVATASWGDNFGLIVIDWQQPDPLLRLQIRDEAGEIMFQQKAPLSVLRHPVEAAAPAAAAPL